MSQAGTLKLVQEKLRMRKRERERDKEWASECSVTRFGEILALGQTFKNLRQTFEGLFCVWQNVRPTLEIFINFWQI